MTTGFILGKFAPLHKGHQLLIEKALEENDAVIVMIYHAPDVTDVSLPIRSRWLRILYPDVQIIEAWDGPMEVGNTPEIKTMHEAYILKMLNGRSITNFYSSEFYGEHVSKALGANDRRIDPGRHSVPTSGTAIRDNAFFHRQYLDPVVYRDLITKVVFLGAPSTGKTTLAQEAAKIHQTVWMPEYGREYWQRHQQERRLTLEQLVEIAEGHRVREDKLILDASKTFFIDTDASTTYMFSKYYHGKADPRLAALASDTITRYDLFFLCDTDIPYDDTWDRSGDVNRLEFQKQIRQELLERKIPFTTLSGSLEKRLQTIATTLDGFEKSGGCDSSN